VYTQIIQSNLDISKLQKLEISVLRYNHFISADAASQPVKVWHTTRNKILQQAYPFEVILRKQM